MTDVRVTRLVIASLLSATVGIAGEPTVADSKIAGAAPGAKSCFSLYGWIETGVTANFASPTDHQNFGRLLDDRSNEPLLNQLVVAAERTLDPQMTDRFDWASK